MKKTLIFSMLLAALAAGVACSENERQLYDPADNVLNLSFRADSVFSFVEHPTSDQARLRLYVSLVGVPPARDLQFRLEPTSRTTAPAGTYEIEQPVFHAGKTVDTVFVIVKRSAELDGKSFLLELKLVSDSNFGIGMDTVARVTYGNILLKPSTWATLGSGFSMLTRFGLWSSVKHELIIEATGAPNFYEYRNALLIDGYLRLSQQLLAQKNAARAAQGLGPIQYEADNVDGASGDLVIASNK